MTFWPTLVARMTAGLVGERLGLVPVAGEVLGRVDDDGAAAVLDAPERIDVGVQQVLGPPDRVLLGEGPELVLVLGEDLLHEPLEAVVELRGAAAGVGEEEAALLDVVAEVLPRGVVELGGLVAVEEEDRAPGAGRRRRRRRGRRPAR